MAAYLDDALPPSDRARLEAHLGGCPHCSEYLAQLRVVIDVSGEVDAGRPRRRRARRAGRPLPHLAIGLIEEVS